MGKIRVLVVDDSLFMRKLISRLIEAEDSLQVIGTARNGLEAVEQVKALRPHVVTLDFEMPELNGLEALKRIMREHPVAVLMLSSLTTEGARETIAALESGAVDFITKPSGSISADLFKVKEELITKIKMAAQAALSAGSRAAKPRKEPAAELAQMPAAAAAQGRLPFRKFSHLVAIGTSTGGPKALQTVITALPAHFPYPVLVVQHMPPKFTQSLALRLDQQSEIKVVEAEDDQRLQGGTVYIAPGDLHMTVLEDGGGSRIRLHREPPRNGHRPSVDVLFESVAGLSIPHRHYVLMTGMGADGAQGMSLAKREGSASTIAEARETCVVFGMPRKAIELQCVDYIVPLDRIAAKIRELTGQ